MKPLVEQVSEAYDDFFPEHTLLTNEELDAVISEDLKKLTEAEIDAIKDTVEEAASAYPKAKQIKSMQALIKKYREQAQSKNALLISLGNDYAKAKQGKNRKQQLAITKKKKAVQAEKAKLSDVIKRARVQLDKLEADRKAFNKKKAAAKPKAAPAKKAA